MSFETISAARLDFYLNHPQYKIIDLRDSEAFAKGHIRGAVNVPYDFYQEQFMGMSKNVTYILCCDRGGASMIAARWLNRKGFNVLSLYGGIQSYKGHLYK